MCVGGLADGEAELEGLQPAIPDRAWSLHQSPPPCASFINIGLDFCTERIASLPFAEPTKASFWKSP